MEFIKKHYEKILLGLVLAGLIGALVFMLFYIGADKQAMDERANGYINNPKVKALTNLDLSVQAGVMARLKSPYTLDFETTNKLFNPMEWQKKQDGSLIKVGKSNVGVASVIVASITPLYLILSLDAVTTNELGARYTIGVENQAAPMLAKRHHQQRFISAGEKPNDTFALVEVKGVPENPDSLVLKLTDSGGLAAISNGKPYRRVDAYTADFRYDLEKKVFRARRIGDKVSFGGTDYLVVEVNQNELILSDQSNQKKTSLPFAP
jgi:hypothetical protein